MAIKNLIFVNFRVALTTLEVEGFVKPVVLRVNRMLNFGMASLLAVTATR